MHWPVKKLLKDSGKILSRRLINLLHLPVAPPPAALMSHQFFPRPFLLDGFVRGHNVKKEHKKNPKVFRRPPSTFSCIFSSRSYVCLLVSITRGRRSAIETQDPLDGLFSSRPPTPRPSPFLARSLFPSCTSRLVSFT